MIRPTALALAVALTGCGGLTTSESMLIACSGYDGTLRSLAGFAAADRLTDEQIAAVDQARPFLNDACTGETPTTDGLLDQVEAVLLEMILIKESVQ